MQNLRAIEARIRRLEAPRSGLCVECELEAMPTWIDGRLVPASGKAGPCTHPPYTDADFVRDMAELDAVEAERKTNAQPDSN